MSASGDLETAVEGVTVGREGPEEQGDRVAAVALLPSSPGPTLSRESRSRSGSTEEKGALRDPEEKVAPAETVAPEGRKISPGARIPATMAPVEIKA